MGRNGIEEDASAWEQSPFGLESPSEQAFVENTPEGLFFAIPETERSMIWRRSMRPAWLDFHHYLTIQYKASSISKESPFPLLRLRTGSESWFTAISSSQIQDDGIIHTQTIDLKTMSSSPQIVGIQIQLASDSQTSTTLVLEQLDFTDHPPGYEFPPPPPPPVVNIGFELVTTNTLVWEAKPAWLSNPSQNYSLLTKGDSLVLEVRDSGKGMKWLNNSLGSLDISSHPYILMHYRCENVQNSASNYAVWMKGTEESRPFYQADLVDDGLWHWAFSPIGISSANQMALQLQNDSGGSAFLEIDTLQFTDGDPRSDLSYFSFLNEGWDHLTSGTACFDMIDLNPFFNSKAAQLLPRMGLDVSWFGSNHINSENRAPFYIKTENPNLVSTDIHHTGSINLSLGKKACEVYLLLGAYFPAREIAGSDKIIDFIDETERFSVTIHYTDETQEEFFPVEISSEQHRFPNNTFSALAIPANPDKTIDQIAINDFCDGGLFALAAVSLNTSGARIFEHAFEIPKPLVAMEAKMPPVKSPSIDYSSQILTLENTFQRLTLDLSEGVSFQEWISHYSGHNLLEKSPGSQIFSLKINDTWHTSLEFTPTSVEIQTTGTASQAIIDLSLPGFEDKLKTKLSLYMDETPEVEFDLSLENIGTAPLPTELRFPDLSDITLGNTPQSLYYAYPKLTFIHGNDPVILEEMYSGNFPMQFMDIYDPNKGWGVCLLVKDTQLIDKSFGLQKNADSASLQVRYPTLESTGLAVGTKMEIAPFSLSIHSGDWHKGMQVYKNWVATWYEAKTPRQKWFQEVYTCRRDYPINGSGYLLNRFLNEYTFDLEIANAEKYLGGADMIDISSWGWNAATGRVGDYRNYELGGLENFRSGISYSQSKNIPVGLYIEGYLLDDRATIFQEHGQEWKLLNSSGQEVKNGAHEVVICPHVKEWQDYMKSLYSAVVSETGADAMYIDVFGMAYPSRACFSDSHNHPVGEKPLRGEYEMTKVIRSSLNLVKTGIPLYTEYTPVDVISQFQDGSFSYTIWHGNPDISPTETNLFRFCFPSFKQIELVNVFFYAMNWSEEGLKKAFFNGEGIWIKGDIASWYDAGTISFYKKSHELFSDHCDAFTSSTPQPFVPTLVGNVCSHRFSNGDKHIFTFYNANYSTISGELVPLGDISDVHIVDLWEEIMLDTVEFSEGYNLGSRIPPRDISCVGIFPKMFSARYSFPYILMERNADFRETELEIVGVVHDQRIRATLPDQGEIYKINLLSCFPEIPEKAIVKLKESGVVLDMAILEDIKKNTIINAVLWNLY